MKTNFYLVASYSSNCVPIIFCFCNRIVMYRTKVGTLYYVCIVFNFFLAFNCGEWSLRGISDVKEC